MSQAFNYIERYLFCIAWILILNIEYLSLILRAGIKWDQQVGFINLFIHFLLFHRFFNKFKSRSRDERYHHDPNKFKVMKISLCHKHSNWWKFKLDLWFIKRSFSWKIAQVWKRKHHLNLKEKLKLSVDYCPQ